MTTRPPAVAGMFYPGEPGELARVVGDHLAHVQLDADEPVPKALVAPHAGYVYSGAVAASAYARLAPVRDRIERVVLLGPAHRLAFEGLSVPSVDGFETPLGTVPVDREAVARLLTLPQVETLDAAHAAEHGLEVQLPFLQVVLEDFRLVPLVVGYAQPGEVAEAIELLWGGDETLVVVSSDLSHYYDYETARRLDAATTRAIEALRPEDVGEEDACGRYPLRGLLEVARRRGLACRTVDLRNSGDTAGPRSEVVGYGSYVLA